MSANVSPEEVFEKLILDASTRKRRSLVIINAVCKEQNDRGSKDFSPVTIGRLSKEKITMALRSVLFAIRKVNLIGR